MPWGYLRKAVWWVVCLLEYSCGCQQWVCEEKDEMKEYCFIWAFLWKYVSYLYVLDYEPVRLTAPAVKKNGEISLHVSSRVSWTFWVLTKQLNLTPKESLSSRNKWDLKFLSESSRAWAAHKTRCFLKKFNLLNLYGYCKDWIFEVIWYCKVTLCFVLWIIHWAI